MTNDERGKLFADGVEALMKQWGMAMRAAIKEVPNSSFFEPYILVTPDPNWQEPIPIEESIRQVERQEANAVTTNENPS